jgi:flagellin
MSIVIGTNLPSLMASHHLRTTRQPLEQAMERLASGSRINSAKDDAAGSGISSRLEAQIRGTDMARRNAQDAISLIQVAEGALIEVQNMAQRIRELAVQKASTGTYNTTDIANIDLEINWLNTEISNIASYTKFNNFAVSAAGGTFASAFDGSTTAMAIPTFLTTAGTTVSAVDTAINSIATYRGTLGAYINRLEYTVNNLSNVSANTSAAHSRIMDTDYAAESAEVAKGQILQQAGASILAQANQAPQYVLSLLQ